MRIRIQIYKTAVGILNLEEEKPNEEFAMINPYQTFI